MSFKTNIKNRYRSVNWIFPFISKYRTFGKKKLLSEGCRCLFSMKVINGKGNNANRIHKLLDSVQLGQCDSKHFYYYIDTFKTVAIDGVVIGNLMIDYAKLINNGFDYWADKAIAAGGDYGNNAKLIKNAIHSLHSRIIDKLTIEKKDRILCNFSNILQGPASSFEEALQRILFFNQVLWQTRHRLNGLGRLDKILGKLYETDLKSNVITKDYACNLLKEFYSLLHKDYEFKSAALKGDVGQIIILGGLEEDGSYFFNELTKLFMQVHSEMSFPDPKILIRVSTKMPQNLWDYIIRTLCSGTGSPLISNDDVVVESLIKAGFDMSDCYNYGTSACWEPFIVGKSFDQNNIITLDYWHIFSNFLDIKQKENVEYKDFNELLSDFWEYLENAVIGIGINLDDNEWAEDTLLSILTEGCTESGVDISKGGAKYNNYGITTVGLASLCDSLIAIKRIVFDNRDISLWDLNRTRKNDYKSNQRIYYLFKNEKGHFGHTDSEAINITNKIIEVTNRGLYSITNKLGGNVKFGLSAPDYLKKGKKAPADFAGRKAGTPYLTHISSNDSTYSEMALFVSDLKLGNRCVNGNVLDFFISPNMLEDNKEKFVTFLKTSVEVGIYQMQMNVMSSTVLIEAKNNPEKYPGLIVRVWGFSSYFSDLSDDYKDILIQRALENEAVNN